MKKLLSLLFVLILIISCSDDDIDETKGCDFSNGDITWLNTKIEGYSKSNTATGQEIYQYTYNEETVFLIKDCIDCSDALDVVYNCLGEVICEFGGIAGLNTCIDFDTEATDEKLIWSNVNTSNLIVDYDLYKSTETTGYEITSVSIEEDTLTISIKAGGCSGDSWEVSLIDSSSILESLPVQRNLKVNLINTELCKAFVFKEYEINISSLQVNGEEIVHFNLEGWDKTIVYNYGKEKTIEELLIGNWSNPVYENGKITFERITELSESTYGLIFKEEFPNCIERTYGFCGTPPITFFDAERYFTVEGDVLKIYDVNVPELIDAKPILLYQYKVVSINDGVLILNTIITEQTQDYNELSGVFDKIYKIATEFSCEEVTEWSFIAYGSKACGGPQGYLPYPTNADITLLKAAVEVYTKMEEDYNLKYHIYSTCDITPPPTSVTCVNGIPTLVY